MDEALAEQGSRGSCSRQSEEPVCCCVLWPGRAEGCGGDTGKWVAPSAADCTVELCRWSSGHARCQLFVLKGSKDSTAVTSHAVTLRRAKC